MKHRYTVESIETMRNEEMNMMNRRDKINKRITVFVTGLCIVAAAASVTAFGFTLHNVMKSNAQQLPSVSAKLNENQNNQAQNKTTIAAAQPSTVAATQAATTTAVKGVHHSGANWNGKGTPLHVFATGKTSYGYDWRYEGGAGLVDLSCDYTFASNSYDFSLIGKAPGTSSMTIYYNTADKTQASVTVNFVVDKNLNVTKI